VVDILTRDYNYRPATAYKHLQLGDGPYWRIYTTRAGDIIIILAGLEKLCRHLEVVPAMTAKPIMLPQVDLPDPRKLQSRRAILYTTGAFRPLRKPGDGQKISRLSLERKTGINDRRQRRYDENIENNTPLGMGKIKSKPYVRDNTTYKLVHHPRTVYKGPFDKPFIVHLLPNRYWTWYGYGHRGMLYRISRLLKAEDQSFHKGIQPEMVCSEANADVTSKRRYFNSFKSYQNARKQGNTSELDCYYKLKSNPSKLVLCAIW
jgi:hypothetical protein